MKFIAILSVFLCLNACSGSPFKAKTPYPDQQSEQQQYRAALESFASGKSPELLKQFRRQHPNSERIQTIDVLLDCYRQSSEIKGRLEAASAELVSLTDELERQRQENLKLNETIDQLKDLLIEQEQLSQ